MKSGTLAFILFFIVVLFEMMKEVRGVSCFARDCSPTYFAFGAGLYFVGLEVAKPIPNNRTF